MERNKAKYDKLVNRFRKANIPLDKPGFMDHENFLRIERQDPHFLDEYSRFVHWRPYDEKYLTRAKKIIEVTAVEMHNAVLHENKLGACIATTMTMARILDLHGVWNCVVRGGLRITFPEASGHEPFCFWPAGLPDDPGFEHGHKWVYAPPFIVVDVTLRLQPYETPVAEQLPNTVLITDAKRAKASLRFRRRRSLF